MEHIFPSPLLTRDQGRHSRYRDRRIGHQHKIQRLHHHRTTHNVGNPDSWYPGAVRRRKANLSRTAGSYLFASRVAYPWKRHFNPLEKRHFHLRRHNERPFMGIKVCCRHLTKPLNYHQTACFYNELRGYPYIFCTFLLFLRIKLTNILNYYLYLPQQKTVSSAISIHNIGMQRSRKNDSFLHNSSRDVEV